MPRSNFAGFSEAIRFAHNGMCLFGTRGSRLILKFHSSELKSGYVVMAKLERGAHI